MLRRFCLCLLWRIRKRPPERLRVTRLGWPEIQQPHTDRATWYGSELLTLQTVDNVRHYTLKWCKATITELTRVSETIRKPSLTKPKTTLRNKKIKYAKNDFQYGAWNSFTLQCGTCSWMTCYWIPQHVRHIGILLLVSISTISPQSTCHSAPVCEILSKSDYPRQKTMT